MLMPFQFHLRKNIIIQTLPNLCHIYSFKGILILQVAEYNSNCTHTQA